MPSLCASVCHVFTRTSLTLEDILAKFADNVYTYNNMPTINCGPTLKTKMAATSIYRFFASFPLPSFTCCVIVTNLNFSGEAI